MRGLQISVCVSITFCCMSIAPAAGRTQLPVQSVPELRPTVKKPGREADYTLIKNAWSPPYILLVWRVEHKGKFYLDAFAMLRKATISFVMFVRIEQLGSHWTCFDEY